MTHTICNAAAKGDLIGVKSFLAKGISVDEKDAKNFTALHYAVQYGHVAIATFLLENGANIHAKGWKNRPPLMTAALCHTTSETVKLLIEAGASLNDVDDDPNATALMYACQAGTLGSIKLLLEAGADCSIVDKNGHRALHWAKEYGTKVEVQVIVEYEERASPKKPVISDEKMPAAAEALKLHNACQESNGHEVRGLLKNGYSIEDRNDKGFTPLHVSCQNKDISITKILVKEDFDPNILDDNNETSMHIAVKAGSAQIVRLLLTHHKLDPDMANKAGQTPIMLAAIGNQSRIIDALLQRNDIDVDGQDNAGNTVLHYSCIYGDEEMVQQVLARKPDITIRNEDDLSPIVLASKAKKGNVVKLLMGKSLHATNIRDSILAFGKSVRQLEGSVDIITPEMAREVLGRSRNIDIEEFINNFNDKFKL